MTQGTLLTRCPHCDTRFRVTNEQLGIAKGKVRCGSCMEVFNALENRQESAQVPASGDKADPDTGAGESSSLSSEDNFVFQDNPDEDAAEGAYAGTRLTFSDDELSDSFRSFDETDPASFDADDDENTESRSVDESWAEKMLFEEITPTGKTVNERPPTAEPEPPSPNIPAATKPEWNRTTSQQPQQPHSELSAYGPGHEAAGAEAAVPYNASATGASREDDTGWPELSDDDLKAEPTSAGNPYYGLAHEPIAVRQQASRGWLSKTVWFLLIIGLIGGLVSQAVYFQFDRLSSIPELRPFYEKGCELAGCELKPLVAVDRIQSRKLVVRTAPEDRNSLIVDAVILNDAEFEQPFPAIGLTFSNLNGDVVAQSLFAPKEYLAGDARDLSAMPPNTPVRIAITIRDPGRDAVNYNISFQPNTQ